MSDNPMSPIVRITPEARVIAFERQSNSIYNKYSPKSGQSDSIRFGSEQPFVWTSPSDSSSTRNLTKYDSQALPIGSTVRDVKRIGKFLTSGTGILYIVKQSMLQKENVFNETQRYNPLSVISATAAKGSTGLIERPKRFLESNGTAGDMVAGALLSLVGMESKTAQGQPPIGAADGNTISTQASINVGTAAAESEPKKGLIRFSTGNRASTDFQSKWAAPNGNQNSGGGLLQKLGQSLIGKLKSKISSTIPFLSGAGNENAKWHIRPEYLISAGEKGPYETMLEDSVGLLKSRSVNVPFISYTNKSPTTGGRSGLSGFLDNLVGGLRAGVTRAIFGGAPTPRVNSDGNIEISALHRYTPTAKYINVIANNPNAAWDEINVGESVDYTSVAGQKYGSRPQKNIKEYQWGELEKIKDAAANWSAVTKNPRSAEQYQNITGLEIQEDDTYSSYADIPSDDETEKKFQGKIKDPLTLDARGFSKGRKGKEIGQEDVYNTQVPFKAERTRANGEAPDELLLENSYVDSKDIIFFYFYDLVNSIYIPFRATVSGVNDLHSPDWEEVSYIGRADKLYIYKGFTREVNFTFTVYASSLKELVPMWKRINYLVGLSRPSKYTESPVREGDYDYDAYYSGQQDIYQKTSNPKNTSQFMFPPMVTFRLGDMFVDQPCVLKSIGVIIPEDAVWETQRGTNYTYLQGVSGIDFSSYANGGSIYQLPTKVDITINMSIMEKERSIVGAEHYFVDPTNQGGASNVGPSARTLSSPTIGTDYARSFAAPDPSVPVLPSFNSQISSQPGTLLSTGNVEARQFAPLSGVKPFGL